MQRNYKGKITTFNNDSNLEINNLEISIEPVQSGSGDPSPENVRPISGWTGAKVANISDSEKQPYFAGLLNGTYGFVDLGTLTWNTTWYTEQEGYRIYTRVSGKASGLSNMVCDKYRNANVADGAMGDNTITGNGGANVIYIRDSSYSSSGEQSLINSLSGVYLVYELATPTTPIITKEQFEVLLDKFGIGGGLIPISWQSEAGTVYGGTLDVTTGVLTVTYGYKDMGALSWSRYKFGDNYCFYANVSDKKDTGTSGAMLCDGLCSRYYALPTREAAAAIPNNAISFSTNQTYIYVRDDNYNDANAFKTAVTSSQIVYELATPQTYQLSPTDVTLIAGENNVWADVGDVEVELSIDSGTMMDDQDFYASFSIKEPGNTSIIFPTANSFLSKNINIKINNNNFGIITNNTTLPSGKTSSGTINSGSYIKIGEGYYNEQYYLAQNNSGTLTIDTSKDNGTINVNGYANVNITGINIPKPSSGTNTFQIKVPNGTNSTVTFTFTVDSNGNTTIN